MSNESKRLWRAIGMMSGTSLDGVDAALVETDGEGRMRAGAALTIPYEKSLRERLRRALGGRHPVKAIERSLTLAHAEAVAAVLKQGGSTAADIDLIGFHGQTIVHRPEDKVTWQIGDAALLAARTRIDVVADFRSADVAAGGQGAPFVPVFHRALAVPLERPLAVLNIGGVANVTWIGPLGIGTSGNNGNDLLAFDTGPGNALLDDWMLAHTGQARDENGACSARGTVDRAVLERLLGHEYFARRPPKSLDRNAFDPAPVEKLSTENGAATLVRFTAESAALARRHFPQPARQWIVTGGGRRNPSLMAALREVMDGAPIRAAEEVGWDGDALEAQAFAYLAVRSRRALPLSFPTTTGVREPMQGGRFFPKPTT
ncbi:MAG: anhydro-N-acetylmuramic acid kinase [Alphaproteobacteria bacterium]|nr:anhydro-N-acetylmuramic acid kinase [Alphaproteobacteria bacterium]